MKKLPFGRALPEAGDTSREIFNALESNISLNDRHTHNGENSPHLLLSNFLVPSVSIEEADWTATAEGDFTHKAVIPQNVDIGTTPIFVQERINGVYVNSVNTLNPSFVVDIDDRNGIIFKSQRRVNARIWFVGRAQESATAFGTSLVFTRGWAVTKDREGISVGLNSAISEIGGALGRRSGSTGERDAGNAYYFFLWPKSWGFIHDFEFAGQLGSGRFERIGTVVYSGTEFWGLISSNSLQHDLDYTYIMEGNGDDGSLLVYRFSGIGAQ